MTEQTEQDDSSRLNRIFESPPATVEYRPGNPWITKIDASDAGVGVTIHIRPVQPYEGIKFHKVVDEILLQLKLRNVAPPPPPPEQTTPDTAAADTAQDAEITIRLVGASKKSVLHALLNLSSINHQWAIHPQVKEEIAALLEPHYTQESGKRPPSMVL